jgi:CheY-like chemotaxis protein
VTNQRLIALQLGKLGCTVDIANHGIEVLEALERASYDVVFMDCQMPEMDGFEATRRIRQSGRFSRVRIVAMTANAMVGDRQRCLDVGMDEYLSKPVRPDDLKGVLVRAAQSAITAYS